MTYPGDPQRAPLNGGESAPVELPYEGYPAAQYLDPYTGQPIGGAPAQPFYAEQPYEVPGVGGPGYEQYPPAPYPYPQQYPAQPNPDYAGIYGPGYPAASRTNGMAIGALIASLVGILTCGVGSIVGAILGHVALGQIKKSGEQGHGMALAGVIVGWVFVGLWLIYWIVVVAFGIYGASQPGY